MGDGPIFWPFWAGLAWIVGVLAVSVVYRTKRNKPIFPRLPADALFGERGCSGRSLDTPWGRIGGARNCLLAAVTKNELIVTPTFPFNLIFVSEIYGLDRRIPIDTIVAVDHERGLFGPRVIVTHGTAALRRVELRVRNPDALVEALQQVTRGSVTKRGRTQ